MAGCAAAHREEIHLRRNPQLLKGFNMPCFITAAKAMLARHLKAFIMPFALLELYSLTLSTCNCLEIPLPYHMAPPF